MGLAQASADHGPVIVMSTKHGVPVYIGGRDARGAMVEGDWGLYRPGHMPPRVYDRHRHYELPPPRGYFPMTGVTPGYGRQEVVPRGSYRRPPQIFEREWSTRSEPWPATDYAPYEGPPVMVAPRYRR